MAFQPVFNQAAPKMIFDGLQMEARMGQRNKEMNQQELMQGMQAVGQVVGQAGQMYQENVAKQRNNLGKLEAYGALGMPPDQLDALSKIKDPDKLAGALAVADEAIKLQQRQGLIDHEYELRAGLAAAQQAQDRTGQVTTMVDPVSGQQVGGYFQNNRQVVPFDRNSGTVPAGATRVDLGGGAYAYMDGRGRPIPTSAISVPEVDPLTGIRKAQLRDTVAGLEGEVAARGVDAKNGPNWWPFSSTMGEKLKGAKAELKSLDSAGGAPLETPNLSGGGGYGSAEDVKAAFQAGKISQVEAAAILRQKFGMQ